MTKPPRCALPPRPVRRKDVKKFTDYCVTLRAFWKSYEALFIGPDLKRELLQANAHRFFSDLNDLMIEHLILQICKLTDPAITMGKRNLTVAYLMAESDIAAKSPADARKLAKIVERIDRFRARVVPARNKLIGHLDLEAAHGRRSHGRAPVAAWQNFWLDLQDFLTIMHRHHVAKSPPFYLNGVGQISDADQLIKALKESTYYRSMLADRTMTLRAADTAFQSKYFDV